MSPSAHRTLKNLLELLDGFHPLVAGTYPLGIHVEGSDLDVLCEVPNLDSFDRFLAEHPAWFEGAPRRRATHVTPHALVLELDVERLAVELFAQPLAVHRQVAFRHMVVEGRLLAAGGRRLAEAVRSLKSQGMKTEPAFARALGIEGDPYLAILRLEDASGDELRAIVEGAP